MISIIYFVHGTVPNDMYVSCMCRQCMIELGLIVAFFGLIYVQIKATTVISLIKLNYYLVFSHSSYHYYIYL